MLNIMTAKSFTVNLSRIVLALLFLFSGYVKSVDYMGTAIKIEEYLYSFHLDFLSGASDFFAILMCGLEFFIGVLLLFNLIPRFTRFAALLFMSFFLLLTLYILIANPVSDCGCFGDAIKLSNTATFVKNIIFWLLALYLWRDRSYKKYRTGARQATAIFLSAILAYFIPLYSYFFVTDLDFLPYKTGVNIPAAMFIPDNAESDVYETELIYRNKENGKTRLFSINDTEWHDENKWEFVETKSKLISKGFTPAIESFDITDKEGNTVTDSLLNMQGYLLIAVDGDMTHINGQDMDKLKRINRSVPVIFLTYAVIDDAENTLGTKGSTMNVYNLDETTLKSFLRAKKGVVMLKEGTILAKRSFNEIFSTDDIANLENRIKYVNNMRKAGFFAIIAVIGVSIAGLSYKKTEKRR